MGTALGAEMDDQAEVYEGVEDDHDPEGPLLPSLNRRDDAEQEESKRHPAKVGGNDAENLVDDIVLCSGRDVFGE